MRCKFCNSNKFEIQFNPHPYLQPRFNILGSISRAARAAANGASAERYSWWGEGEWCWYRVRGVCIRSSEKCFSFRRDFSQEQFVKIIPEKFQEPFCTILHIFVTLRHVLKVSEESQTSGDIKQTFHEHWANSRKIVNLQSWWKTGNLAEQFFCRN